MTTVKKLSKEARVIQSSIIPFGLQTVSPDSAETTPITGDHRADRREFESRFGTDAFKTLGVVGAGGSMLLAEVMAVEIDAGAPSAVTERFRKLNLEAPSQTALRVHVQAFSSWQVIRRSMTPRERRHALGKLPLAWMVDESQDVPTVGAMVYVSLIDPDDWTSFAVLSVVAPGSPTSQDLGIEDLEDLFKPCEGELEVSAVLSPVLGTPITAVCGVEREKVDVPSPPSTPKTLKDVAQPVGVLTLPDRSSEIAASAPAPEDDAVAKAIEEGKQAFINGNHSPTDSNPYTGGTPLHDAWFQGYSEDGWQVIVEEGYAARENGVGKEANPYSEASPPDPRKSPWNFGWDKAKDEE